MRRGLQLLERVTEDREIMFDLHLWFYTSGEPSLESIQRRLVFSLAPQREVPSIDLSTVTFTFMPHTGPDGRGWMEKVSEISDDEVLWISGQEIEWVASEEVFDKLSVANELEEWCLVTRVSLDLEATYEWDFDEEEDFSKLEDFLDRPIFEGLRLDFGNIQATRYVIQPSGY
jgi:hypothetical protein